MLLLADLSGIQDYLFEVRETGGGQARSLRFRSLYIQLVAEAISVRLLEAAQLSDDSLLFCAGGKLAINGEGALSPQAEALRRQVCEIELWLREATQGRLRLSVAVAESAENPAAAYREASRLLQKAKQRSWSYLACESRQWHTASLVASISPNPSTEADRDAQLGQLLTDPKYRHIAFSQGEGQSHLKIAGLSVSLVHSAEGYSHSRSLKRLARHIPRDGRGRAIEFRELARHARGAAMLGLLKADADSLGRAITRRIDQSVDLTPLRDFSSKLDGFFAETLDNELSSDSRWSTLYTVFSGGDDILLVGPWDIVLDFASHLQRMFRQQFKSDGLTISAGVAIVKPTFPMRLAAQQAEDLLHRAKTEKARNAELARDQCAALGQLWKWNDHDATIESGRRLANWVNAGAIRRGWLNTLLELALLRLGEAPTRDSSMVPAMATSRLAYHVARNWPSASDRSPEKRAARQWINQVAAEFDRFELSRNVAAIHLPTILRYAMLATRTTQEGNDA